MYLCLFELILFVNDYHFYFYIKKGQLFEQNYLNEMIILDKYELVWYIYMIFIK